MTRDAGGQTDGNTSRIVVPSPDPTALTTDTVQRETKALREILEARIIGMERDIARIQGEVNDSSDDVEQRVKHLEALHGEKFHSIETQFTERDIRTEQAARDSKIAIDAALQAAKEAVGEQNRSSALAVAKSEASTTKQIDQMATLIQSMTNGLNDKIEDLKLRLISQKDESMKEVLALRDNMSRGQGAGNQAALGRANAQYIGMLVVGVLGLIITMIVGSVAYFAGKS